MESMLKGITKSLFFLSDETLTILMSFRRNVNHFRLKSAVKKHSSHPSDELFKVHEKWILKRVHRFAMKGLRHGENFSFEYGEGCQDIRDPNNPDRLHPFFHSSILIPHYGVCFLCVD